MLKKFLISALVIATSSFAVGWDYFNPKYAGTAQVRTGVSFDHESESAEPYLNTRVVIDENVEISTKSTSSSVTSVGVKVDILDGVSVASDFYGDYAILGFQGYVDGLGGSFGSEISLNTDTKEVGIAFEADYYFLEQIQYIGFNYLSSDWFTLYCGWVYPTEKVDLGAGYFLLTDGKEYVTSGWSFDLTFKF